MHQTGDPVYPREYRPDTPSDHPLKAFYGNSEYHDGSDLIGDATHQDGPDRCDGAEYHSRTNEFRVAVEEATVGDELTSLVTNLSCPAFITDEHGIVVAFNAEALQKNSGRDPEGRPLNHLLWAREKVGAMEMAYINRSWMIVSEERLSLEASEFKMVTLRDHPDLPSMEVIESARDMIAVMLHRFRSPMTGMQGYLDLLLGNTENDREQKRLETLNEGMSQLNGMLDELEQLYDSHSDSNAEPLYLQAVIREAVAELNDDTRKQVMISEDSKHKPVRLSRKKVRGILDILLKNAAEHTSGHQNGIHIELESGRKVVVTNYGEPIPDFLRARMFHPFMTNKAQNMGIGLTHAHLLARYLGASVIPVKNCREEGISFTLLLPPSFS
ncbi:histidine kinase dimerization/phospho-acceptor domain-containing protein [Balneolales bacterium ANBcel1]|nr:histidine kinase dimerization/phospho-acceptor domain-containing protein [Balneolales bacterium ANBcel1]